MDTSKMEIIDPNGDVILTLVHEPDIKSNPNTTPNATQAPKQARFQVSSKHLMLPSPYFMKRLGPNWSEGRELALNGVAEIKIEGFDSEALLIILNAMHSRNDQVPSDVTFELLVKIAQLTEYFQCNKAIGVFGATWFNQFRRLRGDSNELPGYLLVSHVFGSEADLKRGISCAWKESNGPFDTKNLPLPSFVKDTIDANRESFNENLASHIGRQVIQSLGTPPGSRYTCESLRLGFWAKGKRLNEGAPAKDDASSPKSLSEQIWQWNEKAKHTCPEKWCRNCSNFMKLLGPDLTAQIQDARQSYR